LDKEEQLRGSLWNYLTVNFIGNFGSKTWRFMSTKESQ